jgi:hypothetical protein
MNFKYLIYEQEDGALVSHLFSSLMKHDDIERRLGVKTLSAAHVSFHEIDGELLANVHGRSGSLNMDPRPEDAAIIEDDYRRGFTS